LEYVDGLDDGDRLKGAMYAELIGVNNWRTRFPLSGFSIIASYSDRAGADSVAWGGLFTFRNVYSVGVTDRSGDIGVFLSIDLANFYRDRIQASWDKRRKD